MPKKTKVIESTIINETPTVFEKETAENSTAIKLIQKDIQFMTSGIEDIKKSVTTLSESMNNGFVRKEEFGSLKSEVDSHTNMMNWALKIVVGAIIVALLSLVLIKTQ